MHIHHTFSASASTLSFQLDLSHHELQHLTYRTAHRQSTLANQSFRFLLPNAIHRFEDVHPDLLGLVVLLIVHPFVHQELHLSFAVSRVFADAVAEAFDGAVRLFPVDPDVPSRQAGCPIRTADATATPEAIQYQPSVAFNGRVHSTMAAAVVGTRAQLVALDHWNASAGVRTSPYPSDALYYSLDRMENQGFRVAMVKTDVASVCEPHGFAHPLTACVGNVLLADVLHLHTVHMGSALASMAAFGHTDHHNTPGARVTGNGKQKPPTIGDVPATIDTLSFRSGRLVCDPNARGRDSLASWWKVFGAVDLQLEFPLCGASDACIVKLLHDNQHWPNTSYCLYARPRYKCGQCAECVYYDTTHRAVTSTSLGTAEFAKVWRRCAKHLPEATTCVLDLASPNRWHLFWIGLTTCRDTMPADPKGTTQRAFDVFHACASQRFAQMRFGLHGGMMALLGDACRKTVVDGWKGLYGGRS